MHQLEVYTQYQLRLDTMTFSEASSSPSSGSEDSKDDFRYTIYEKVKLIYNRTGSTINGQRQWAKMLPENIWDLVGIESNRESLGDGMVKIYINPNVVGYEFEKSGGWNGVILENSDLTAFEIWFVRLMLTTSCVEFPAVKTEFYNEFTNMVAEKFANELKNTAEGDEWDSKGLEHFKNTVDFFTSRLAPVEAVLPAFPCKSSNLEKVSGPLPDKGEELALTRLITFAKSVKQIYPPGIILHIVSDGHVFSDCSKYFFFFRSHLQY